MTPFTIPLVCLSFLIRLVASHFGTECQSLTCGTIHCSLVSYFVEPHVGGPDSLIPRLQEGVVDS